MSWHVLERDGAKLRGLDNGEGPPVVFQHGLGGDEAQIAEIFPASGYRRLTLECRGQGKSEPGNPDGFSIANFADDVLAFADARKVDRFVMGGISMGAAISLRIAIKHPERVKALVLARPAWRIGRAPENMQVIAKAAPFIRTGDRAGFSASQTAQMLTIDGPDNLASLLGNFDKADPLMVANLLNAIAADGPGVTEAEVRRIKAPTLVIGTGQDFIHPMPHAEWLAKRIAGAKLVEITSKAADKGRYVEEFRAALAAFLSEQES
ncbi:MAG: alpha/beta hydrolase [Rhizobiaceae bacterium]